MRKGYSWDNVLFAGSFALLGAGLYLALMYAHPSPGSLEGVAQRIFYFHVPLWWVAFMAYLVTFISSIVYLANSDEKWDNRAFCAAEIGTVFTTAGLITGVIWGKAAWGVWWAWDVRLTTALVLWFIFIGYFLVRSYAPPAQARNFAAVISIIGSLDAFIVFMAIRWWNSQSLQHPSPMVGVSGALDSTQLFTLMFCLGAFTVFFLMLYRLRLRLKANQDELVKLNQRNE